MTIVKRPAFKCLFYRICLDNEFEELKEDETLFLMYPVLPQFFGHLTNENATQFMSQTENSLVVGFYLRCKPTQVSYFIMLYSI